MVIYENVLIAEKYHFSVEILVFGPLEAQFQTNFLAAEKKHIFAHIGRNIATVPVIRVLSRKPLHIQTMPMWFMTKCFDACRG